MSCSDKPYIWLAIMHMLGEFELFGKFHCHPAQEELWAQSSEQAAIVAVF
jgi:hypothetical protein